MKGFMDGGGRILVLLAESSQDDDTSNTNIFLEDFGIIPNMGMGIQNYISIPKKDFLLFDYIVIQIL